MITPAEAQPDTLTLYGFLPDFLVANDAAGGYQFLSWLDGFISEGSRQPTLTYAYDYEDGVITQVDEPVTYSNVIIPAITGIQAIDTIVRDTPYQVGWASIMDVNQCPPCALPWLGQFVGVRLGMHPPQNVAGARAAIKAENSFQRGTAATIQATAQKFLTGGNVAVVQERTSFIGSTFAVDPYAITVTYPGAGAQALTYGQLNADYADYAAVDGAFADYADMSGDEAALQAAVTAVVPAGLFVYFNPT